MKLFNYNIRKIQAFDEKVFIEPEPQANMYEIISSLNFKQKLIKFTNYDGYSMLMALVTLYSIFAIDFQKAFFNQPAAYVFGYVHIIIITIFTVEIIMNSFIRESYFCSFYFWIDVVSTLSMVLQITWIDNWLAVNSSLPAILTIAKVVKASRLSRIGSRAAKIILLFITMVKNKQKYKQMNQQKQSSMIGGEDVSKTQTFKIDDHHENDQQNTQIILNKKQSSQLPENGLEPIQEERQDSKSSQQSIEVNQAFHHSVIKPTFKQKIMNSSKNAILGIKRSTSNSLSSDSFKNKQSQRKTFQIGNIVQRLQQTFKLQPIIRKNVDPAKQMQLQKKWQQLCLKQQQQKKQSKEKINSDTQNFKLGQQLKKIIQKNIIIMIMSLIIILPLISADTWLDKDPTIDKMIQNYMAVAKNLTQQQSEYFVQQMIKTSFNMSSPIISLSLKLTQVQLRYPGNFSNISSPNWPLSDFMETEIISTKDVNDATIIFNNRQVSQLNSVINIIRSCFITLLLIFSTIIFMYSIQKNALLPLQNMCKSINKISINPFEALKEINSSNQQIGTAIQNNLETNMLEKSIWKMSNLLILGAGQHGADLISTNINQIKESSHKIQIQGKKIFGVFMYIYISDFQKLCKIHKEDIITFISEVTKQIHEISIQNGGFILQNNCPYYLIHWKTPDDISTQFQTTKYFVNNPLKNLGKVTETQRIIQLSFRTFLQISIKLRQYNKQKLIDFQINQAEQQFESFLLQAGFHLGQAYQGPLGTNLKLQIKSLGFNINYTKKLCRFTEKYRVSNLISAQICQILQDHQQNKTRKIDYIKEKGTQHIYWLYTYDFTLIPLLYPQKFIGKRDQEKKKRRKKKKKNNQVKQDQNFVYKKRSIILKDLKSIPLLQIIPNTDNEIRCQQMFTQEFYTSWNVGLDLYYSGEWKQAMTYFQSIKQQYKTNYNDYPSHLMIQKIKTNGISNLQNWNKQTILDFQ